ncbi:type II toxin-antitoxin system RelE/ParE family toxin [Streptomyces kaniharaensis]|uniref:Type II toxin-antitoxin system RelE/ParE family toxin n=1 Tax=Streptomyces kaniharaensis TaxID=212423 RepID=A0A6N7KX56_9ACTN|nr:type II toxin-antitoxin system RelE/ParE family toxin [Streptomyces kaniharaensis]MQS16110.1 type II toxin-antitoxin system RelE/ParE family toxin [Streptomyces kaniharaensis]
MSPESPPPRRAEVAFSDLAARQLEKLTAAQIHRLDRALVTISVRPDLGQPMPDGRLRDYRDDIEGVRVIYHVTVLRTIVVVGYVEV